MYRFALRPRWILSHLLVLAIVVACIGAGLWQLGRLQEKRSVIDRHEARTALEVASVGSLLEPDSPEEEVAAAALRRVTARGRYLVDEQVRVRNRTYNGSPGYWLLTPLRLDDGSGVVVNRGWVPLSVGDDPDALAEADPPEGEVQVLGLLTETQVRGRFGAADAADGTLDDLARADIGRIDEQTSLPLLPAYITLESQEPPSGTLPVVVEVVEPGEGPHLGYAVQWFIFASIAAGGYPLILRKVARERAAETVGPDAVAPGQERPRRPRSSKVPVDD